MNTYAYATTLANRNTTNNDTCQLCPNGALPCVPRLLAPCAGHACWPLVKRQRRNAGPLPACFG